MRKSTSFWVASFAVVMGITCMRPAVAATSYAEDRAQIENLMARYLFAMDWRDAEAYADTFTPEALLVTGWGDYKGRKAIVEFINRLHQQELDRAAKDKSGKRPPRTRHSVTNLVLVVKGDKATARAYWTMLSNSNDERRPFVQAYGHYEDELVKQNGEWRFARRAIFNEMLPARAASEELPTQND